MKRKENRAGRGAKSCITREDFCEVKKSSTPTGVIMHHKVRFLNET